MRREFCKRIQRSDLYRKGVLTMAEYDYNAADTWMCSCGKTYTGKFCIKCSTGRGSAQG